MSQKTNVPEKLSQLEEQKDKLDTLISDTTRKISLIKMKLQDHKKKITPLADKIDQQITLHDKEIKDIEEKFKS